MRLPKLRLLALLVVPLGGLVALAMPVTGCGGRCEESGLMPSDTTYVEGCGCVANPDLGVVREHGCEPRGTWSPPASSAASSEGRDAAAGVVEGDGGTSERLDAGPRDAGDAGDATNADTDASAGDAGG